MRFVALDNETGGLTSDTSLLTSFLAILDADLNIVDELELLVKPDDGIYRVNAEALNINKINLLEHDKKAIPYSQAGAPLYEFLRKHSDNGANKLVPFGHNVMFDILGICDKIMSKKTWDHFCGYRLLCTGNISQFLKLQGKLPSDIQASLGKLAAYFGIDNSKAHTSKGDVLMCIEVLKKMKDL